MASNVFLFCGNDEYPVDASARRKVDEICPEAARPLALEVIDGRAVGIAEAASVLGRCLVGVRTSGLVGGLKVVWLREAAFLGNAAIMKNEPVKRLLGELAADFTAHPILDRFLVVSAPGADQRSTFCKTFGKTAEVSAFNRPGYEPEARLTACRLAVDLVCSEGFAIEPSATEAFIDKVGFDTRLITGEIGKLLLYKGDDHTITLEDIRAITSPTDAAIVWDFTDAVAERRLGEALRLFRRLLFQKESSVQLVIAVERLFSSLLLFRECAGAGWVRLHGRRVQWTDDPAIDDCFSGLPGDPRQVHWYRASKLLGQALQHSARRLEACRKMALDTHEMMLSSGSIPQEIMLEILLARLCGPAKRK